MSNIVTRWILEMKDMISAPAKKVKEAMSVAKKEVGKVGDGFKVTGAKAVKSLKEQEKQLNDYKKQLREEERQLKALETAQKKMTGKEWQKQEFAIKKCKEEIGKYKNTIESIELDVADLTDEVKKFEAQQAKIANTAMMWNQASDMVKKFADSLDFAKEYKDVESNIQRMTGASGDALQESSAKVHRLAAVYGDSGEEIARSANAMSKAMGISFNDALSLAEEGYKKGANLNGDMLEQMREYSSVLQPLGYTAEDVMAKMAQAGKDGVFNDKALDALKEGGLSLREMGQAQVDALAGIGLLPKDLKDKTVKEAIETIGAALEASGATVAQKQAVIADIFKGAGEDMGMFINQGLMSTPTLENMPAIEQAGSWVKGFMADVQSWSAQMFGSLAIAAQDIAPMFDVVGGAITLFQSLSKVTWLQTIATKALSVATGIMNVIAMAGPWGWIALAIGSVILAVKLLANKFEWAAGIVGGVKESFMDFGKAILKIVLMPLRTVLETVGILGEAIGLLFEGKFGEAWGAAKKIVEVPGKLANEIADDISNGVDNAKKGATKAIEEQREKKEADKLGVTGPTRANNEIVKLDGQVLDPDKKSSKKDSNSLSGTGGSKALTMNLTINNHFSNIKSKLDVRSIADEVAGVIVGRVRDAAVSFA